MRLCAFGVRFLLRHLLQALERNFSRVVDVFQASVAPILGADAIAEAEIAIRGERGGHLGRGASVSVDALIERLDGEERLFREDPRESLSNEGEATSLYRGPTRGTRGIAGSHDRPDLGEEILSDAPRFLPPLVAFSMGPEPDESAGNGQRENESGGSRHQAVAPRLANLRNRRKRTTVAKRAPAIAG